MSWLKKLLGSKGGNPAPEEPPAAPAQVDDDLLDRMSQEGFGARTAFFSRLGEVDPDVIAPIINPTFMGGPRWPSLRQSWRIIRRPASTIFASDGLSDPFDDDMTPLGFRVEVCAEAGKRYTDDLETQRSWELMLVLRASQAVAGSGGVYEAIERDGIIVTTVLRIPEAPEPLRDAEDRVGVIIGFPSRELPREIELPDGKVLLLVVKPLLPSELTYIENAEDGQAARRHLVSLLLQQPRAHFAIADREAVV